MLRFLVRLYTVGISVVIVGLGACTPTAIPDYEVLVVPRPTEQFAAGKAWIVGTGPTGEPLAKVGKGSGASSLSTTTAAETEQGVTAAMQEWVNTTLGLKGSKTMRLELSNLQHEVVQDVYAISENIPVLWETVQVDSMTLRTGSEQSINLTASTVGNKLTEALGGKVSFTATSSSKDTYEVKADRPVVAAIRVIDPQYRVSSASKRYPLDLSTNSGLQHPQSFPFGFELTPLVVDPIAMTAVIKIDSTAGRQFNEGPVTFQGTDAWISPKKTTISSKDPELKDALFVWDKISLVWSKDLSQCEARVVRQYLKPKVVRSGLSGVR